MRGKAVLLALVAFAAACSNGGEPPPRPRPFLRLLHTVHLDYEETAPKILEVIAPGRLAVASLCEADACAFNAEVVWLVDGLRGSVTTKTERVAAFLTDAAVDEQAGRLYFSAGYAKPSLITVDATTGMVERTVPLGINAFAIDLAADGRLWIADRDRANILVVDASTGRSVGMVRTSPQPYAIVAGRRFVWILHVHDSNDPATSSVTAIDADTMKVAFTKQLSDDYSLIAEDSKTGRLFASSGEGTGTDVIEPDGGVKRLEIGGMVLGSAVDPVRGMLYVSDGKDLVKVFDTGSLTKIAELRIGKNVVGLAVDPAAKRLYVAVPESNDVLIFGESRPGTAERG